MVVDARDIPEELALYQANGLHLTQGAVAYKILLFREIWGHEDLY